MTARLVNNARISSADHFPCVTVMHHKWTTISQHDNRRAAHRSDNNRIFSLDPSLLIIEAAVDAFEPRIDPSIALAAAIATTPPILFWARVIRAEQKRQRENEEKERMKIEKERARLELKKKLFGK